MDKTEMIEKYVADCKAEIIRYYFTENDSYFHVDVIREKWFTFLDVMTVETRESSKNGGFKKLAGKKSKNAIDEAIFICKLKKEKDSFTKEDVENLRKKWSKLNNGKKINSGHILEMIASGRTVENYKPDNVPFNVAPDCTINGKGYQIKATRFSLINERQC